MRKQLSVTLACFLLASVSASAQGWKTYEEAAQGKAYEKSDCVTLLDSTLVSVQPTGQGSFAVCKVIKVQTPKGKPYPIGLLSMTMTRSQPMPSLNG